MIDGDVRELVEALHAHLAATAELPVRPTANRWLGEAEAVADDIAGSDAAEDVVRRRVEQIGHLLAHVDETGSQEADEQVVAARDLVDEIDDRLG